VASAAPAPRGAFLARHGALLAVLVVLVLAGAVRWRLLDMPLERDEGEYAYAGQLILQGVPPYLEAYNMKFPGTYYAYAIVMACFGETARGIRLGLLLVNAGTALLLFGLGRRLIGSLGGAIGAIAFALLTLDLWSMCLFAHATHFVLLPALAGLYLLARASCDPPSVGARRAPWLLMAGVLLGIAVLMKQHAFTFPVLGVLLVAVEGGGRGWRAVLRDIAVLAVGVAAPLVSLGAVLMAQGVLGRFWFWTFEYAHTYVTLLPASRLWTDLPRNLDEAAQATRWIWVTGGVGLVALWVDRWPARSRGWLTGLLVAAFIAICPGFFFRQHYFILLLPAVALLSGVAVTSLARLLERIASAAFARLVAVALFAGVCSTFVIGQGGILFRMRPVDVLRIRYGPGPFTEAREVGRFLRERGRPGDRIAVLGSEPEIYFYARQRSATGYMYMYPLTEVQPFASRMQDEMMAEIEAAHPRHVVFVQEISTWNLLPQSDLRALRWAARYVADCYRLVGVVDMFGDRAECVWGDEAPGYRPRSPNVIYVYERKSDMPCAVGG
jgi:hypothetical protein